MIRIQWMRSIWCGLLLSGVSACDQPVDDCPKADTADLVCPAEIGPFEKSECEALDNPEVGIDVAVTGSLLEVTLANVLFRDNNEICGYANREANTINVLLQPCVLVSDGGVSKGDCWYDSVSFDVDEVDVAGASNVTVLHRVDVPVGFSPEQPRVIASAPLP